MRQNGPMIALGLALVAVSGTSIKPAVFKGWKVWDMQNGQIRLLVAPDIGRIVYFARWEESRWGRNVLWLNSELYGKTGQSRKNYRNYGGDKVWNAPQARWGWPPDPALDAGPYSACIDRGQLTILGPYGDEGIRLMRRIVLMDDGQVKIVNSIQSRKSSEWSIWPVAQVDDPAFVTIPAIPSVDFPDGWRPYSNSVPPPSSIKLGPTIDVVRDPKTSFKVAAGMNLGWACASWASDRFQISGHGASLRGAYPDKGAAIQIYSSADPTPYMELELPSPIMRLTPGKWEHWVVLWKLWSSNAKMNP